LAKQRLAGGKAKPLPFSEVSGCRSKRTDLAQKLGQIYSQKSAFTLHSKECRVLVAKISPKTGKIRAKKLSLSWHSLGIL
jgi:hypothetical protein